MREHLERREFLASAAGMLGAAAGLNAAAAEPRKIAAAVTIYTPNSHAELIAGRLPQSHHLNGQGERPQLKLVSLYADQFPENDLSRGFARKYGFTLAPSIAEALTLGGKELAVEGVLLIAEHGKYPVNAKEQTLYPRRKFFEETVQVFERSGRVVPVFLDKHLAASWEDARWIYDSACKLKIPLMAGSSLPVTWRKPALDTPENGALAEMLAISYHTLDGYGFHALEMVQCLAERRKGGETGVAAVRCVEGAEVWKLGEQGRYDRKLLDAALNCCEHKNRYRGKIEDAVKDPVLFQIDYRDGFRASVLTLNYAVGEWAAAWREVGRSEPRATLFWTQEARPMGHFTFLVQGIERMMLTGKPAGPVERTLLTTGMLDALLTSKQKKGSRLETPQLAISYQPTFSWKEPPPPPPSRGFNVP